MENKILSKKNVRVGLYSSLLLIILAPISVIIHESGHMIICASDGDDYTMQINLLGGLLHCHGTPQNTMLFYSFGGVFAALVLSSPFILWRRTIQRSFIVVPLVSLISGHAVNAAVETFLNGWYLDNMAAATIIINAITAAVFLATWVKTGNTKLA